jgi:tetratricopeptide (TPR) repeat protein
MIRRDPGLALLLAALAAAAVIYLPTLAYGLVNYDDPWLVHDNWLLRDHALGRVWFDLDVDTRALLGAEYLPIRDVSVMLDFAIWGDHYAGFHVTNLVVYLASIVAWFGALTRFGIDRRIAGLAVLLWAVAPSHAESVAWLSERKGLLAMLFAGLTAYAYARYRATDSPRVRWLVLAAAFTACAIWSKATGAFAIAALAGLEWALPAQRHSTRRALLGLGVIAVVAAAAFLPIVMVAVDLAVVDSSHAGRIASATGLFGFYIRLAGMTMPNAVSYPIGTEAPSILDIVLGVGGLAASVYVLARGSSTLRAAAIIWLLGWFPVSRLVLPVSAVVVADRYLLFASLGFALVLAAGLIAIPSRRARIALAAVLVLASCARALDARSSWRDSAALWDRAVDSNPRDAQARNQYAEALATAGHPTRAIDVIEQGLALDPPLAPASAARLQFRLALLLVPTDRTRAVALMRESATNGFPLAMTDLAVLLFDAGNRAEALTWARQATSLLPGYAHGLRIHGKVALATNHSEEALTAFSHALALSPTCTEHVNLALALITLQRAGARAHLERCANDPQVGARARELLPRAR